jgi:hypothetical protein
MTNGTIRSAPWATVKATIEILIGEKTATASIITG